MLSTVWFTKIIKALIGYIIYNMIFVDDFIQALQSNNDTVNTKAQCIAACTMEKEKFVSIKKLYKIRIFFRQTFYNKLYDYR